MRPAHEVKGRGIWGSSRLSSAAPGWQGVCIESRTSRCVSTGSHRSQFDHIPMNTPTFAPTFLSALVLLGCGSEEATMSLTSPSIQAGQSLPDAFTCEGKAFGEGSSPELNWTAGPSGTQSYAIL